MNSKLTNPTYKKNVESSATIREDIYETIKNSYTKYDLQYVLDKASKEVKIVAKEQEMSLDSYSYKAYTLFEFEKCILAISAVPDRYRTFLIDFNKKLQQEYQCETPSEKATAELTALNYIRTIEIQNRINSYLALGTMSEMGIKFLAVLSKELDKANRHYISSLQTLKMLKQPSLEVNIKSRTAIVGQNQIIQSNTK